MHSSGSNEVDCEPEEEVELGEHGPLCVQEEERRPAPAEAPPKGKRSLRVGCQYNLRQMGQRGEERIFWSLLPQLAWWGKKPDRGQLQGQKQYPRPEATGYPLVQDTTTRNTASLLLKTLLDERLDGPQLSI